MITVRISAFTDEAADSLFEQIEALKRNNLNLMELRSIDKKNISKITKSEAIQYQKTLSQNNIKVWSIASPLGKQDIDLDFEKYKETVGHIVELAQIFQTDKVRIFSFYNAYEKRDMVIDYLSKMVEIAEKKGVKLYHENEREIYGDTAVRVQDIMKTVQGLGYIYDPANYIQVGEKPNNTLPLLHSTTDYFHIKDAILSTGQIVPAGEGDCDIKRLVCMISKDTVLSVEPHLITFSSYSEIDNSVLKVKYKYSKNSEAFDVAVGALKSILKSEGYIEKNGEFIK